MRARAALIWLLAAAIPAGLVAAVLVGRQTGGPSLTLATTTSLENSGLLDELVPAFERAEGIRVRYLAVGTGEAMRLARDGNADLLFVHDRQREERFVREGYGTARYEVMQNYFTLLGPPETAAEFADWPAHRILQEIARRGLAFVSRGDRSGTHSRERSLWKECGPVRFGAWYLESGTGMAATLRIASEKRAFTLSDTATYLRLRHQLDLAPCGRKEPALLNVYALIPVSPERFPHVNAEAARAFVRFVLRGEGRRIIREFGRDTLGQPLFTLLEEP